MRWKPLRSLRKVPEGLRDVAAAGGIVVALLLVLLVYTGGNWPPMVIVESGSMMHVEPNGARTADTPYGRFGTIDPGDVHFLRKVTSREDVELWVHGGEDRYGRPGDVIAYRPNGNATTPVIHRAMTYVEVQGTGEHRTYTLDWIDGETLVFGPEGIYLPALGFDEAGGFTPESGYKPDRSGFLTKGDNARTNAFADQAGALPRVGIVGPVPVEWVVGKARGEIPWVGLLRLIFLDGRVNQANEAWVRVGNAYAPIDLWTMLFLGVSVAITVPLALDVWRAWRDQREADADLRRGETTRERPRPPPLPPSGAPSRRVEILEVVDHRHGRAFGPEGGQRP